MLAATTNLRRLDELDRGRRGDRASPRIVTDRLARLRDSLVDLSLDPARAHSTRSRLAELALFLGGIIDDAAALESALARAGGEDRPKPSNSGPTGSGVHPHAVAVSQQPRPRVSIEATIERRLATMMEERDARLLREAAASHARAALAEDFRVLRDEV